MAGCSANAGATGVKAAPTQVDALAVSRQARRRRNHWPLPRHRVTGGLDYQPPLIRLRRKAATSQWDNYTGAPPKPISFPSASR